MTLVSAIVSTFTRGLKGGLPKCVKDIAIAWWKNFNSFISSVIEVDGVLVGDAVSSVVLGSIPDVTGNKTISCDIYIPSTTTIFGGFMIWISDGSSDMFSMDVFDTNTLRVTANGLAGFTDGVATVDISSLKDRILNVVITKTTRAVTSIKINGIESATFFVSGLVASSDAYFYNSKDIYMWNVNINNSHTYSGQPAGNQDSAWADNTGSIDGALDGVLSTTSISDTDQYVEESIGTRIDTIYYGQYLDATSGQINFYRSNDPGVNTFSYTDPSAGSLVEDVDIPVGGLYAIPANGICNIITSDGSEYPVCERAGTVLHDVENGIHISVTSPSWSESLYGSDYLNQCGFVNKELSDQLGLPWEAVVNGSDVALDDDTLVPVKKNDYINELDAVLDFLL